MSLSLELKRYLQVRRNLGYNLGTTERVLKQFVLFMESKNEHHITSDLFLEWKEVYGSAQQCTWAYRLGMVRIFASWLHSLDSGHQIPPSTLIPSRYRRKQPYIYTDEQIRSIIEAAGRLSSKNGLRSITYPTFLGLISVTGLRINEAISLNNSDVDLHNGIITLQQGKNAKNRILPITECTKDRLKEYTRKRDRLLGHIPKPFFISDDGIRLNESSARYAFSSICQEIGLREHQYFNKHGVGPRIHDFRHTFAVRVIMNWYREGKNVDKEMLKLVTYLGHDRVVHTYWYIEAVPELLALASERADNLKEQEVQS